ncbi:MAG: hypothetical protein ACLFVK_06680 [Dehalococcoidia bacterium]
MRRLIKSGTLVFLCLIAVVVVMPGCIDTNVKVAGEITQELDGLSLVKVWNMVAGSADLQEQGAELGSLRLRVDEGGNIETLLM